MFEAPALPFADCWQWVGEVHKLTARNLRNEFGRNWRVSWTNHKCLVHRRWEQRTTQIGWHAGNMSGRNWYSECKHRTSRGGAGGGWHGRECWHKCRQPQCTWRSRQRARNNHSRTGTDVGRNRWRSARFRDRVITDRRDDGRQWMTEHLGDSWCDFVWKKTRMFPQKPP